ncbi:unnamed protein product [Durusdinium trenchii]|uniref:Uncharacterized protein n=1 Tax=Durusdinium trenchii TaxID=1381693 RepID=A0ABP0L777_9DINO
MSAEQFQAVMDPHPQGLESLMPGAFQKAPAPQWRSSTASSRSSISSLEVPNPVRTATYAPVLPMSPETLNMNIPNWTPWANTFHEAANSEIHGLAPNTMSQALGAGSSAPAPRAFVRGEQIIFQL